MCCVYFRNIFAFLVWNNFACLYNVYSFPVGRIITNQTTTTSSEISPPRINLKSFKFLSETSPHLSLPHNISLNSASWVHIFQKSLSFLIKQNYLITPHENGKIKIREIEWIRQFFTTKTLSIAKFSKKCLYVIPNLPLPAFGRIYIYTHGPLHQ